MSAIDVSAVMVANLRRRADELGLVIADVRAGDGEDVPRSRMGLRHPLAET